MSSSGWCGYRRRVRIARKAWEDQRQFRHGLAHMRTMRRWLQRRMLSLRHDFGEPVMVRLPTELADPRDDWLRKQGDLSSWPETNRWPVEWARRTGNKQ